MLSKIEYAVKNGVGLRSIVKSYMIYSKTKAGNDGKGIFSFMVSGSTLVSLENGARIVNKGKFMFGLGIWDSIASSRRNVFRMEQNSKMVINGDVFAERGTYFSVKKNATLELGNNVWINSDCRIICSENIKIGDGCLISWETQILDSDIHKLTREEYAMTKPIAIGENVWIGNRTTILKGVHIGSGSVVATGAVVTRDVPERCLVGGVPAKVIRENVSWSRTNS